jgi:type IV pilus assembly protein PilC
MPVYRYKAVDAKGYEVTGRLEAGDEQGAATALRNRALLVLDLRAHRGEPTHSVPDTQSSARRRGGWVRSRDRIQFFRQMALMLRSGITVFHALQICSRHTPRKRLARTIERIAESIQQGQSLSAAMAAETGRFTPLTIKLIESAEATGDLDPIMERIAESIERKVRLRASLLTSMLYPSIVIVVSLIVALFLVVKVIPKFAAFFMKRNIALPSTTKMLVDLSSWVQEYGLFLLVGLGALVLAVLVAMTRPRGRLFLDKAVLRVPVFGKLIKVAATTRLANTLSSLVRSGVTLLESLRITEGVMMNRAFAARIAAASERILLGDNLAASLTGPPIPDLFPNVVSVGERSGAITNALDDLGDYYEKELTASIRRMSAAVEPVMILLVGGMVGFVYIAFFQAVFQLVGR